MAEALGRRGCPRRLVLLLAVLLCSAFSTVQAANTELLITTYVPDSACPGQPFEVCAQLTEACGGGVDAPLPGRPVYFFLNSGSCGIGSSLIPADSAFTDSNGVACVTLLMPVVNGQYSLRVKYNGEPKPSNAQPPNSACDPTRRIQLSNANDCRGIVVTDLVCEYPPVATCPGDTTILVCNNMTEICLPGFFCTDPDSNVVTCEVSLGTLGGDTACFTPSGAGTYPIILTATDEYLNTASCTTLVMVELSSPPLVNLSNDTSVYLCSPTQLCFPVDITDVDCNIVSVTTTYGAYAGTDSGFDQIARLVELGAVVTQIGGGFPGKNLTKASDFVAPVNTQSGVSVSLPNFGFADYIVDYGTFPSGALPINSADRLLSSPTDLTFTTSGIGGPDGGDGDGSVTFAPGDSVILGLYSPVTTCNGSSTDLFLLTNTGSAGSVEVQFSLGTTVMHSLTQAMPAGATGSGTGGVTLDLPDGILFDRIKIKGVSGSPEIDGVASRTAPSSSTTDVCFTPPSSGAYNVIVTATDACGGVGADTMTVTVTMNQPPVANAGSDFSVLQCAPTEVCFGVSFSDPEGMLTLTEKVSGPGTLTGNQICFTPSGAGTYTFVIRAVDYCNVADLDTVVVTITGNHRPEAVMPPDVTVFQCTATQLCHQFTATDADNDALTWTKLAGVGTVTTDGLFCFTPTTSGIYSVAVVVTDPCGSADTSSIKYTVTLNSAPVANNPGSAVNLFQCVFTQVCYNFTAVDVNGGTLTWTKLSGSGTVSTSGQWCFTPAANGTYTVTAKVADSCGAADTVSHTYNVTVNQAPSIVLGNDTAVSLCAPQQICLNYTVSDPNAGQILTETMLSGFGTLDTSLNKVCFTPTTNGMYQFIVQVTDACGVTDVDTANVLVSFGYFAAITCPTEPIPVFLCDPDQVCQMLPVTPASATVTTSYGTWSSDQLCFQADTSGTYVIRVIAASSCGSDTCFVTFNVNIGTAASITCPAPQLDSLCMADTVCTPISINGSGVTVSVSPIGWYAGGNVCFVADTSGTYTLTVIANTSCGSDTCTFSSVVALNLPPVAVNPPATVDTFMCASAQVCRQFAATDPEGHPLIWSRLSGAGTVTSSGLWCFTAAAGSYSVTAVVTDDCGAADTVTMTYNVTINGDPMIALGNDTTFFECVAGATCLLYTATDPNNNITSVQVIAGDPSATINMGSSLLCFNPSGAGTYEFIVRVTDACGRTDQDTIAITINVNHPPVVNLGADQSIFDCTIAQHCLPVSITDIDNNITSVQLVSGPGTLSGSQICFTPAGAGTYTFVVSATDLCNQTDVDTVVVTYSVNRPPVAAAGADQSLFLCAPVQICWPASVSDPDGNIASSALIQGPGVFDGSQICFTPAADGSYLFVLQVTDGCGLVDLDSVTVTVALNEGPVCFVPNDTLIFQCTAAQVCLPVYATDPDGNLKVCQIISGPGSLVNGTWCYTPASDHAVTVVVRCEDSCGVTCESGFTVEFDINGAPQIAFGADINTFQCTPTQICLPYTASDPEGLGTATVTLISGPGTLNTALSQVCYTPAATGTQQFIVGITDDCGRTDRDTINVTVTLNLPPVVNAGPDDTYFLCEAGAEICWPVSWSDPNGNIADVSLIGPGVIDGSLVCFNPTSSGDYEFYLEVTDACGVLVSDTVVITVINNEPPTIQLANDTTLSLCSAVPLCFPYTSSDPDGTVLIETMLSGFGTINTSSNEICFTPGVAGDYQFIVRVADSCGAIDQDTLVVTIQYLPEAVVTCPAPSNHFLCTPAQICTPVSVSPVSATVATSFGTWSAGQLCFQADTSGTYVIRVIATGECGSDTCFVTADVEIGTPAQVTCPAPQQFFFCAPSPVCIPVAVSGTNPVMSVSPIGTYTAGNVCFTADTTGHYVLTVIANGTCGADTCTVVADVVINSAPVAVNPSAQNAFQCTPTQLCYTFSASDVNGGALTWSRLSGPGSVSAAGQWCFTPTTTGTYTVVVQVADACGAADTTSLSYQVTLNSAPQIAFGGDITQFQCAPTQICLPYTASDPDGLGTTTVTLVSGPGTLNTALSQVCFTPAASGTSTFIVRIQDQCGLMDYDTINVMVTLNAAPVVTLGADESLFLCEAGTQICRPTLVSDADGNLSSVVYSGPGTHDGTFICFSPMTSGVYQHILTATDACGAVDVDTIVITVQINAAPTVQLGNDTTISLCAAEPLCFAYTTADADGALLVETMLSGFGSLDTVNNEVCFTPGAAGSYEFIIEVSDSCGAIDSDTLVVTIQYLPEAIITCPTQPIPVFLCAADQVCQMLSITPGSATVTTSFGSWAAGQLCFQADTSGIYMIEVIASEACGADTCLLTFDVEIGVAANITCPTPDPVFLCEVDTVCVPVSINGTGVSVTVSPTGWYSSGNVCFVANTSGTYNITVIANTACGSDTCTFGVPVTINSAPVAVNPSAQNAFQCTPTQLCYTFSASDVNGGALTWSRLSGPGSVSAAGQWCFTPTTTGTYTVVVQVADACGAADTTSLSYQVTLNSAPQIAFGADVNQFQCASTAICIPYTASDPDGLNTTTITLVSGSGTVMPMNSEVCFTPVASGVYTFIVQIEDQCGVKDRDTINVTVQINSAPVVNAGPNQSLFLCQPGTPICWPASVSDVDGNLSSTILVGAGTFDGSEICFTPGANGNYQFILRATDACGVMKADTVVITVLNNQAPIAQLPNNFPVLSCGPEQVCFNYTAVDPDGTKLTETMLAGYGTIDTSINSICFTPPSPGDYQFILQVADSCGTADADTLVVHIEFRQFADITCPADPIEVTLCDPGQVCYDLPILPVDAVVTSKLGTYAGGELCFYAAASGTYVDTVIAAAYCNTDTCIITFNVNIRPMTQITCPDPQSFDICSADTVCVPVTVVTRGDVVTVSPIGWYSGGNVCFFADTTGHYELTVIVSTDCGADTCLVVADVNINSAPVADEPAPIDSFLCAVGQVCYTFAATDIDNDNLTWSRLSGAGTVTAAGIWCFTPTEAGTYTVVVKVTDPCGAADTTTLSYTITLNRPPVVDLGGNKVNKLNVFQCNSEQQCPTYTVTDPDNNVVLEELLWGAAALDTVLNRFCFTPDTAGTYRFIMRVTDACGRTAMDTLDVVVDLNDAPTANAGADQQVFMCAAVEMCWPAACTDPDGNIDSCYVITPAGYYAGGEICFTPDTAGVYRFILRTVDLCGVSDQDTAVVTVNLNDAPVCSIPNDTTIAQCSPAQVKLPVSASDADGNFDRCEILTGPGSIQGGEWVFTPSADQTVTVQILCIDSCGLICQDQFTVIFEVNEPPVVAAGIDTTLFLCAPQQVCRPVAVTDDEGNLVSTTVISPVGATYASGQVCFNATAGQTTYPIIVQASDACGRVTRDTCVVTVKYNHPPTLTVTPDFAVFLDFPGELCFNAVANDIDNNLAGVTVTTPAAMSGNEACFFADTSGIYCFVVTATDGCGEAKIDTICINVAIDECIHVQIEKTHNAYQGESETVQIFQQGSGKALGGYDLLIQYDPTALLFNGAAPGDLLTQCGWEYFTYRQGPDGNCSGCPSGLVRLIAIAETNNGANHPGCFIKDMVGSLAKVDFLVSNDRNLECQYVPIRFFWVDCGDNTFSSQSGDTLWISRRVFDFELNELTNTMGSLPGFLGAPDLCITNGGPGKPSNVRCVDFTNGGIDIICADSIDARGDLNLNGTAYEISDAVLYTNFFVYGIGVFDHYEAQVAASDVNADGIPLSVADLVYLIRVIVGDTPPLPKLDPNMTTQVEFALVNGVLEIKQTDYQVGAIALTLEGEVTPELLPDAQGMDMRYSFDGVETRVLIYNFEGTRTLTGGKVLDLGNARTIKTIDVGAFDGFVLGAKINTLPDHFELYQNYPNPFNPTTTIEFALPKTTDWKITIYNVLGQTVQTLKGEDDAGYMKVEWDAGKYASGVYLYRLTAGEFTATKKMVLLK